LKPLYEEQDDFVSLPFSFLS